MNATYDVWTDPELRELVVNEPELAALADALAQASVPRRRLTRPSLLAAAVLVVAAAALALVAPWNRSHGSLADQALAALGSGPVVHVVTETPTGAGLVDIASGSAQPLLQRDELWYDADLGLRRDLTSIGATVLDDELETPQGGFTSRGIVYDCTWIAAHPVAATKARVSCNASGDNGTTPHVVPRPKPTLDPGLAGFADSYRQALASGEARDAGSGELGGEGVDWLAFTTREGTEKVALDATTHAPVLLVGPQLRVRIASIETIPYDASDFARPTPAETPDLPSMTRAGDGPAVSLDGAAIAAAYPGAVWPGAEVAGLPLVQAEQQPLSASFADGTPKQTGAGLELVYGTLAANGRLDHTQPWVELQEAPSPTLATFAGFVHGDDPAAGTLYVSPLSGSWGVDSHRLGFAFTDVGGLYVTIQTQGTGPDTLLQVARALTSAA